ncbi:MAG TPA: hypothetical protein VFA07_09605 [Chthonomonadaceae bacterium]|nr:hypothetical protein [Chthonomonadaceae bacterium]
MKPAPFSTGSFFAPDGGTLIRYDVTTGTETPLYQLTRVFDRSKGMTDSVHVSPDGKQVLWADSNGGLYSASVDGSGFRRWWKADDANLGELFWLSDSHQWVCLKLVRRNILFAVDSAHIYSLLTSQQTPVRIVPASRLLRQKSLVLESFGPATTARAWDGGILLNFAVYHTQPLSNVNLHFDKLEILPLNIDKEVSFPHAYALTFPNQVTFINAIASPQGDRIAWETLEHRVPAWSALLHRILPAYKPQELNIFALKVSRLDGSQTQIVGTMEMPPGDQDSNDVPQELRWTPDGKRLSFLYHRAIWTVPTD